MTNEEAIFEIKNANVIPISKEAKVMAIKALSEQRIGHWIPVSERLPEENGYYLTTTMYHEVYCDYWEGERFGRTEAVIAWMSLPEPYKKEGD